MLEMLSQFQKNILLAKIKKRKEAKHEVPQAMGYLTYFPARC